MGFVTGSGVGGNPGSPQTPMQRELEATAWTEVNKLAPGINFDSLDTVMTEISPRYVFGYLGAFGYRSSPGQPLLDHPLESVRAEQPSRVPVGANLQEAYNGLFQSLPDDLQGSLTAQKQPPPEEQSSTLTALDSTLSLMANFIVHLHNAAETAAPGTVQAEQELLNFLFPYRRLKRRIRRSG